MKYFLVLCIIMGVMPLAAFAQNNGLLQIGTSVQYTYSVNF